MNVWSVLGIEFTRDKDNIKKAYRRKLVKTNPEDNPEGFMELRAAYEEALVLADKEADDKDEENDQDSLTAGLTQLYKSFWRRIDVGEWKKIFDRDEFVSLDTAEDSFVKLLRFLMDNYFLPKPVWKIINETFDIELKKEELCSVFPEDFIEYIISNSKYDDLIDYSLFEGDENSFDRYLSLYYNLDAAIRKREIEEQERLINELEELDVYHPYFEVCKIRHQIQVILGDSSENEELSEEKKNQLEIQQEKARELYNEFSNDIFIINCCGDVALVRNDYENAKRYYDFSYELEPDNYMVKGKQAEISYCLGEYEKSRDMYMELLKINHYDNNVRAGMIRANQGIIEENRKLLIVNPEDTKARMEICWSLYQSYRFEEGIEELNLFDATEENKFEYYNLKGRTYLCMEQYDAAMECFFKWKEAIEGIPEHDTSEDAEKKRKRYEYVNFLIGDCYLKTKQLDEARKYFERALKKEHEEIILCYEAMCELEYEDGNMQGCLNACESLLKKDSRSYIGYDYMSKAYYSLGYARETLSACEHAISIYPYVSAPYELEIKVFLQLERIETAREILKRFRSLEIDSDRIDYAEASILLQEDKKKEAVSLLIRTLNRGDESMSDMDNYCDLFMMLGDIYEQLEDADNAISMYEKVIELEPEHSEAYGKLGMLYRDKDRVEDSIKMLSRQLSIYPSVYYYIQRAIIYRHFNRFDEAEADYLEALKIDDSSSFCYSRLGLIYEAKGEFDKALLYFDKAIQCIGEDDEKKDSKVGQIIVFKARVFQCMSDFSESEKNYKLYIEKCGLNADVIYDYSEMLQRNNKTDDAICILLECINKLSYDEDVQMCIRQLISIYGEEGYINKAYEAFELAKAKDPLDARAYASLAEVFRKRGMYSEARKYYEGAIDINKKRVEQGVCEESDNACYYTQLAEVIQLEKAFFKQNVDFLLKKGYSILVRSNNPNNFLKLVIANKLEKKYKEALELADRAVDMPRCNGCFYSRCHEAFFEKGLVYERMKEYKLALACYREALKIVGHNSLYEEKIRRLEDNDSRNRFRNNK